MSISINHNLMAANTARNLNAHYTNLATSTQRLSSGLRINGAADDAAGLAIRELMRADIAALRQGMRNANDGISLLQTMDGALGVIDEKLIRMKELAEQAATGTYDSTQRLMIDSEFQAMGSEIDRIANATDFNGIKLLRAKMISWFEDEDKFVITNPGEISNLEFNGQTQVTRGVSKATLSGFDEANAKKYIDKNNQTLTISINLTAIAKPITGPLVGTPISDTKTRYALQGTEFSAAFVTALGDVTDPKIEYSGKTWSVVDYPIDYPDETERKFFDPNYIDNGTLIAAMATDGTSMVNFSLEDKIGAVDLRDINPDITEISIDIGQGTYSITNSKSVQITDDTNDYTASYDIATQTVTVNLKKGGTATLKLDNPLTIDDTITFDIDLAGEVQTVPVEKFGVDPDQKLTIHFGPMNDSAEDYYDIKYANCTREGLGLADVDIQTQDKAQNALVQINEAIVNKDKVRAYFGAMQNRLENTMTNLSIQAENLQTAESRISDADIAQEMMTFVRNQILVNSSVAMLAQANSMPQMVMSLIH